MRPQSRVKLRSPLPTGNYRGRHDEKPAADPWFKPRNADTASFVGRVFGPLAGFITPAIFVEAMGFLAVASREDSREDLLADAFLFGMAA